MEFCDVFIWRVETVLRWEIGPDKKRARTHRVGPLNTRNWQVRTAVLAVCGTDRGWSGPDS